MNVAMNTTCVYGSAQATTAPTLNEWNLKPPKNAESAIAQK